MASSSGSAGKSNEDLSDEELAGKICWAIQNYLIRKHGATFIAQFHLTQSLMDFVGVTMILPLPEGSREAMNSIMNDEDKAMSNTPIGLTCMATVFEVDAMFLNIHFENTNYILRGPWDMMAQSTNLQPNVVVSLWGYRDEVGQLMFLIRLDGHAGEGEPLPFYNPKPK